MAFPGAQSDPPVGYVVFPHDLVTGFLVPNYGTKMKVNQKFLLAVAEDGTRTGRIKSGQFWTTDLTFKSRPLAQYLSLWNFWSTVGFATEFAYYDKILNVWYIMAFDSDIEAEYVSFNLIDFNVTLIGRKAT